MPAYDYSCPHCGIVEVIHGMRDFPPRRCTKCGRGRFKRIFNTNIQVHMSPDSDWKDKWIPQLGKEYLDPYTKTTKNPASHVNSQNDAVEKAKRQGYQSIEID